MIFDRIQSGRYRLSDFQVDNTQFNSILSLQKGHYLISYILAYMGHIIMKGFHFKSYARTPGIPFQRLGVYPIE